MRDPEPSSVRNTEVSVLLSENMEAVKSKRRALMGEGAGWVKVVPGKLCQVTFALVPEDGRILTDEREWWGGEEQRCTNRKAEGSSGAAGLRGQRQQDGQVLWWEFRLER